MIKILEFRRSQFICKLLNEIDNAIVSATRFFGFFVLIFLNMHFSKLLQKWVLIYVLLVHLNLFCGMVFRCQVFFDGFEVDIL